MGCGAWCVYRGDSIASWDQHFHDHLPLLLQKEKNLLHNRKQPAWWDSLLLSISLVLWPHGRRDTAWYGLGCACIAISVKIISFKVEEYTDKIFTAYRAEKSTTTEQHSLRPINLAIIVIPMARLTRQQQSYTTLYPTHFVYSQARKWQHLVVYWLTETNC